MSASRSPQDVPSETDDPRTVAYDPNDPFWHDTEDDDDDIDYVPAPGGSEDEDEEGDSADLTFHGGLSRKRKGCVTNVDVNRCCRCSGEPKRSRIRG